MTHNFKVSIFTLLKLMVFLLPFVQFNFNLRLGAMWTLSNVIVIIIFLNYLMQNNYKKINRFIIFLCLVIIFLLFSDLIGFLIHFDDKLTIVNIEQIKSIPVLYIVNTFKLVISLIMVFLIFTYINTLDKYQQILKVFLYSSLFQAIYGIYEEVLMYYMPNLHLLLNAKAYYYRSWRIFGTFFEPSQCGQFMLVSILVLNFYLYMQKNIINKDFFYTNYKKILFLFIFVLLLSLSRTALLVGLILFILHVIINLKKIKILIKSFLFLATIIIIFFIYVNIFMSQQEYDAWIYLLTADRGNGGFARINEALMFFYSLIGKVIENPFGEGLGILTLDSDQDLPKAFVFRLLLEGGLFVFIMYYIIISKILWQILFLEKNGRNKLLLLLIGILLIQINYNSLHDSWIYFILIMLYIYPSLVQKAKR
jgi:hypothetical protein